MDGDVFRAEVGDVTGEPVWLLSNGPDRYVDTCTWEIADYEFLSVGAEAFRFDLWDGPDATTWFADRMSFAGRQAVPNAVVVTTDVVGAGEGGRCLSETVDGRYVRYFCRIRVGRVLVETTHARVPSADDPRHGRNADALLAVLTAYWLDAGRPLAQDFVDEL